MQIGGEEYLESLRDGRTVYLGGERVDDVTTHPAFRNAARSFAMIYDLKKDPDELTNVISRQREIATMLREARDHWRTHSGEVKPSLLRPETEGARKRAGTR